MELTYHTDYSFRVLIYLGLRAGSLCQIADIAEHYSISRNHLVKVVHHLAQGGFVSTFRGKGGGVTLARDPATINVGKVVRYSEGPMRLVECFRGPGRQCAISQACTLAGIFNEAAESFLATLDRYSLADLLVNQRRLARILQIPAETSARSEIPRRLI
ncbi:MAG TPA: Rrf2 family transcriptional regulator [Candidatus Binataceae bacterium]|nr:Rrf2 family transcriptional regulator [Candidatus Binataceae bacterium]